jgi:tetratricopeptide (TPR) repeat protein
VRKSVVAIALLGFGVAGLLWWSTRRLPVEEARRFLNDPIEVGAERPAAPTDAAPSSEVERKFSEAEAAFAAGDYEQAAETYAFVVQQDPNGVHAGPAQWQLTRSRLRSGDGSGALAALDDLIGQHADFLGQESVSLRAGLELMEKGELNGAYASFERVLEEQPDSGLVPLAHAMMARIHWTHGQPMDTIRAFARMFASVKDRVPAYQVLAKQLDRYANGDEEVRETFDKLSREAPEGFRDIYQYLEARSLLEQDRFDATRESLEELRRRFPEGDFGHIVDLEHAWNLLRNGKPAEALAIFQRLEKETSPQDKRAFDEFFDLPAELPLGIARCHLALGNFQESVVAFERAIEIYPSSIYAVENRLGLARAYEGTGNLDKAAEVLRDVIAEHPDEPQLWAIEQQLDRVEARIASADADR